MHRMSLASDDQSLAVPDAEILDACLAALAAGESAALETLYKHTSAPIYGFALSILKNAPDAEDVLHDCYVNVYAAAPRYTSGGKPMAWMLTIARNLCLQKLREGRKTADLPQEDWEKYLEAREGMTAEERLLVAECLTKLTDEERQIVVLHAVAGFKHRETAELLGLPLPTVLSKYNRALKKLKALLWKGEPKS